MSSHSCEDTATMPCQGSGTALLGRGLRVASGNKILAAHVPFSNQYSRPPRPRGRAAVPARAARSNILPMDFTWTRAHRHYSAARAYGVNSGPPHLAARFRTSIPTRRGLADAPRRPRAPSGVTSSLYGFNVDARPRALFLRVHVWGQRAAAPRRRPFRGSIPGRRGLAAAARCLRATPAAAS